MGPNSASHSASTAVTVLRTQAGGPKKVKGQRCSTYTSVGNCSRGTKITTDTGDVERRLEDARHILLRCEDKLVVDHVVWCVTQPKERRRRMQVGRHPRSHVDVLANPFHLAGIGEVARTDRLAHNIPIVAARHHCHAKCLHLVQELTAHLAYFFHRLEINVVLLRPYRRVAIRLPLPVSVEQRQMVRLWHKEFFSCCVALFFSVLRLRRHTAAHNTTHR